MEDINANKNISNKKAHSLQLTADRQIPYGRQQINKEDIEAVIQTLNSDFLTQGPKVKEFEEKFAAYVGAKYAVAVNNATSGLHLAMLANGLKAGERVITTPITFAASANCVRMVGGEVWFADIDPDTYLIDINAVEKLLKDYPRGFFKGIIPVDFAGLPVNTEKLRKLANEYDLWMVEDACHAPGGYYMDSHNDEIKCGSAKYSDMAIFSFHPVKHIACGEGGMVTTDSEELYQKLSLLRTHGITKENMSENHGGWYYEMQTLGYNYRLTDFQSAMGITQLGRSEEGIARRQQIARNYQQAFKDKIKFQFNPDGFFNAYHLFVIEVANRKGFYDYLKENGIFAQIHYIPVHQLPYYQSIGYADANLKNAERYYEQCISLPMYPSLTDEEQEYVIATVFKFNNGNIK
jgi:UDP-4-amino-4,6-dideoxy-N-acetyl-beta-L-altrosamine transaminase